MVGKSEPLEPMVTRIWPILTYGSYSAAGLGILIVGVRRHGFSRLFALATAAAMFILAAVWLVTALRPSSPLTSRRYTIQNFILLGLLFAHNHLSF